MTDPQGYTSTVGYDAAGSPTTLTDPAVKVQRYTYNANGSLATVTDQRGNVTTYRYSGGNLSSVDPPGTAIGTTTMTFDALSRPVSFTDGKGQRTTMSYDALDRPLRVTHSDGSFVAYAYDGNGNTISRQEGTGTTVTATTSYGYDSRNLACWQLPAATTARACGPVPAGATSYGYDSLGRLVSYTDAGGTVSYAYGMGGRLTQITEAGGKVTKYGVMDSAALPSHPTTPPLVTYPNGVKVANTSDDSDRLVRTRATNSAGAVLMDLSYGYRNPASPTVDRTLIYTKTDNLTARTTSYGYDPVARLTSAVEKSSAGAVTGSWSYAYDAAGNRTSKTENGVTTTYTYNSANQLTAANTTTYAHDANGNMVSSSAGLAATYNAKNQTTTIKAASGTTQGASYAAEGQSELTKLGPYTYTNNAFGVGSESGKYITRRPDGGLVSVRSGASTYYLLQDNLGSVVALTDAYGNKAAAFSYDPYGKTTSATGNTALSPFRFAGELYSAATGMSKMGERYYNPDLGRWTQQDPLSHPYSPTEANRYAYAGDDPVNNADPSGLASHGGYEAELKRLKAEYNRALKELGKGGTYRPGRPISRITEQVDDIGRMIGHDRAWEIFLNGDDDDNNFPPPGGGGAPAGGGEPEGGGAPEGADSNGTADAMAAGAAGIAAVIAALLARRYITPPEPPVRCI